MRFLEQSTACGQSASVLSRTRERKEDSVPAGELERSHWSLWKVPEMG